jgi:hypothetical protein
LAEFSSRQIREVKRNGRRRAVLFNGVPSHASILVERDYVNFPTNVLTAPITIEGTPFGQAKTEISERLKNTEWTRPPSPRFGTYRSKRLNNWDNGLSEQRVSI